MKPFIVSLCDLSGTMVAPWLEAGYSAMLVDPQHEHAFSSRPHPGGGRVWKIGRPINDRFTWYHLRTLIEAESIAFVAGFPPCTDVAVSGARYWEAKRLKDPYYQAKAAIVAEQCRCIGQITGAPWFFENPVSAFSSIFGKPDHTFNPCDYGGYLPEDDEHPYYPDRIPARDAYTKKTCLWTGNGFVMPPKLPVAGLPFHDAFRLGGKSQRTKNIRSVTPRGFAQAVYMFNSKEAANDDQYNIAGNG